MDIVSDMHLSASKHHTENALVGKDAITGEIVDGAAGVADLADLADLDQNVVADLELCAQGERKQVDALCGEILPKVTFVHIEPAMLRGLD